MLKKLHSLILILFTLIANHAIAALSNEIFDSRVKSVQLFKNGSDDRYPIIALDAEQLKLSFDMMGAQSENLQYSLTLCDANWNPSAFNQFEYIKGMQFDNISDFKFSTNTYIKYVHYNLVFPNENMKPNWAGNYILKVFRNFDENDLLLQRRCMIIKRTSTVDGSAKIASLPQFRYTKQEVLFSVNYNASQIVNPLEDVKVVVLQNYRWDNALTGLKPMFSSNQKLDYSYPDANLFDGRNEFRYFDIRNLKQYSINVRSKRLDTAWHVILNIDESRNANQYFQYVDYNGRQLLQNKEGFNSDIDGDYAYVNFYLNAWSSNGGNEDIYVIGEFTDWKCLPAYKMYFNKNRQRYDLEVPMKQGRYEYAYAVQNKDNLPDDVAIEGSHSQTENEYLVLVYTRNLQYNYDELIGARRLQSNGN
jgi:hypothetical protein